MNEILDPFSLLYLYLLKDYYASLAKCERSPPQSENVYDRNLWNRFISCTDVKNFKRTIHIRSFYYNKSLLMARYLPVCLILQKHFKFKAVFSTCNLEWVWGPKNYTLLGEHQLWTFQQGSDEHYLIFDCGSNPELSQMWQKVIALWSMYSPSSSFVLLGPLQGHSAIKLDDPFSQKKISVTLYGKTDGYEFFHDSCFQSDYLSLIQEKFRGHPLQSYFNEIPTETNLSYFECLEKGYLRINET